MRSCCCRGWRWTLGWRPLVVFGLVLAGGLLLPAASYGWNGNLTLLHEWYRTVTDTTGPNLLGAENISFASMWAKWLGPGPTASRLALASTVIVVAAGVAVMSRRKQVTEPNYLEGAYFLILVALLSPQGWDYVLLIGLPAYVLLVDRWIDLSPSWRVGGRDRHLPHEFHDFRSASAGALYPPHAVERGQRRRCADCRHPHPVAVAGDRVSARWLRSFTSRT